MSTVGSRTSHRFSTHSRSTSVASNSTRRLSTIPYSNSPINSRFSERRLSVPREPQQLGPRSKDDDQSTEMITIALAKAQNAVLLDQRNNVTGALDGYSQCCAILAEVIAKETDSDDITRLRQIHDTYSVRMHVLSKMQLDPNATRDMPPLPTQADLVDFEDEEDEDEFLRSFAENRISHDSQLPRYSEIYPPPAQKDTPSNHVHRTTSSRDSNGTSRAAPPLSGRKSSHSRTSSYARTYSQDGILSSLEQIPNKSSINSVPKRETIALPEMSEEEMDDAAFLERITRGFTSEEEILEEEPARPSTASTTSSASHQNHQQKKLPETFNFDQPPSLSRTETEDYVLPSPRSNPRQPTPPPKSKHDRARNTSSPLPTSTAPPRPSSAKKNLSVSNVQAQPMLKSLSANNAIPNADEVIVPGNLDAAPAVPPKIKKRPHLIRVVSETTMRTNYGSSRLSTFESSPVSPSSTGSAVTPGTSTGPGFFSETSPTAVRNAIVQDREGAAPPESPPEDPYHRPYWLMKSLIASMRNSKGAYVTQKLFIPQGVWTAKNAKIKATEEKMNCFHTMTMAVRQVLEADDRNIPLLLQVQFRTRTS